MRQLWLMTNIVCQITLACAIIVTVIDLMTEVKNMKKGIHPEYHENAIISCACGAKLEVGATVPNMRVEVCSKCHPFYTGAKTRLMEKGGRVERFRKKYGATQKSE